MAMQLTLLAYDKEDLEDCGVEDDDTSAEFFGGSIDLSVDAVAEANLDRGYVLADILKAIYERAHETEEVVELGSDCTEVGYIFTQAELEEALAALVAHAANDDEDGRLTTHIEELREFLTQVDWEAQRVFATS